MRDKILNILKAEGSDQVDLTIPDSLDHGDFTTNLALKDKDPKNKAAGLVRKLSNFQDLQKVISKVEVAGPGFINFWLSNEALLDNLNSILKLKDKFGSSALGKGKTIVVEYSSPNIAKHFGIGHLRSTVIGQAIYNLYDFLGYKAIGENHLGDWGTQFGVILAAIDTQKLDVDKMSIDSLQDVYVKFNREAKDDPLLWEEAKKWFKKLEKGDSKAREIWQKVRRVSLIEFDKVYSLLGVKIDQVHGESFYENKIPSVVKEVLDKGLSKKSQGAEVIEFKKGTNLPPAILVKSDGTSTYFARDLAALKFRLSTWNPSKIVYEVGSDQILHFRQVFETARILGWIDKNELVHVAHGLVRLESGKMSTRLGQTVGLMEVLEEAIKRASFFNKDRKVASSVGIGAIKYYDLLHSPLSDIIFDWEKVFLLEGNSAPYLQYTFARSTSVAKKAKLTKKDLEISSGNKFNYEELVVLRTLVHFPEVIENAAKNYSPNLLCNYLFELAQRYNSFYNNHKIIGSKQIQSRVMITMGSAWVIKNGLNLLGIEPMEAM